MRHPLTLLQRAVVQQLRNAGYDGIAEHARDSWTHDRRVIPSEYPGIMAAIAELVPDFARANAQVT
jgi:hypothetical protein